MAFQPTPSAVLGFSALLWLTPPLLAAPKDYFPVPVDLLHGGSEAVDLGFLNPAPAGAGGRLTARDGHFVDGEGRRVRLFGTNLVRGAALVSHETAEKLARRLKRLGFNAVRLHGLDVGPAPAGLLKGRGLDPEQLDRLDYLFSQLKANGIYVDMNLHVYREYPGLAGETLPRLFRKGKTLDFFSADLIQQQEDYAAALLGHVNPYTGLSYAADPAVALVEINNENTLVGNAFAADLLDMPAARRADLESRWRAWLKKRYTTVDALRKAWAGDGASLPTQDLGLPSLSREGTWRLQALRPARAAVEDLPGDGPAGGPARRVRVTAAGTIPWAVQLHRLGVPLEEGAVYTLGYCLRGSGARSVAVTAQGETAPWTRVGLHQKIPLTTDWRCGQSVFTASRLSGPSRVTFGLGPNAGTVDIAQVTLRRGTDASRFPTTLDHVDAPIAGGTPRATGDWIDFLRETEDAYAAQMVDFLKNTLRVQALVTVSQASYGDAAGLWRENRHGDFIDVHGYWGHPHFPGKPWDRGNWTIPQQPLVEGGEAGRLTLTRWAAHRLAGKPFTVSEFNHPTPSVYNGEMFPLTAAYAAFQDWDGIFQFNFASDEKTLTDPAAVTAWFPMATHPGQWVMARLAALIFRRGLVAPAEGKIGLRVPGDRVTPLMATGSADLPTLWAGAGVDLREALDRGQTSVTFVSPGAVTAEAAPAPGPLRWSPLPADQARVVLAGDGAAGVIGRFAGETVSAGPLSVRLDATASGRGFASVLLVPLEGTTLKDAPTFLLAAVGEVNNEGLGWNAARTSVGTAWGHPPAWAEGLTLHHTLHIDAPRLTVEPLDAQGNPLAAFPAVKTAHGFTFTTSPAQKALWYRLRVPPPS